MPIAYFRILVPLPSACLEKPYSPLTSGTWLGLPGKLSQFITSCADVADIRHSCRAGSCQQAPQPAIYRAILLTARFRTTTFQEQTGLLHKDEYRDEP